MKVTEMKPAGRVWTAGPAPLLPAKLAVPEPPAGLVERPRLRVALDGAVEGSVTSVVAPAGWGKTALLADWLEHRDTGPVGWLTVEADDDGPRFWRYLRAALASAWGSGQPVLPSPPDTVDDVDEFLIGTAYALAGRDRPVLLVLDDLHLVRDRSVLGGLEFLCRHAGSRLRLILVGRAEPALPRHRWRLSGDLTELRADDLAMLRSEAVALLAAAGVVIPDGHLDRLHRHTEGWPAALRLAALAMRHDPDPARCAELFSGTHKDIAGYLDREVLAGLDADAVALLRRIAVVDAVCGELADALTGQSGCGRLLAELERANAFVTSVAGRPGWYRLRPLFAERLRADLARLTPARSASLHARAAAWYLGTGAPVDALRHTLAARDWLGASSLLVEHWPDLVGCAATDAGGDSVTDGTVVIGPVSRPPDAALRADPELSLACAADRLAARDLDGFRDHLVGARSGRPVAPPARDRRLGLIAAGLELAAARLVGDIDRVAVAAAELIAVDPATVPSARTTAEVRRDQAARAVGHLALAGVHFHRGDLAAMAASLTDGSAEAETAGVPCARLAGLSRKALLAAVRGDLRAAEAAGRAALGLPPCGGRHRSVHSAHSYLALALVRYHRDLLDSSRRYLDLAVRCGDPVAEPALAATADLLQVRLCQADGDLAGGWDALRQAHAHHPTPSPRFAAMLLAAEADLLLAAGSPVAARSLLLSPGGTAGEPGRTTGEPAVAAALARAHLAADEPAAAAQILLQWTDDGSDRAIRLEAGLLGALAAYRLGDHVRAGRVLERVLALAEPDGYRRPFAGGGPWLAALLAEHLDAGTAYQSLARELLGLSRRGDAAGRTGPPPPAEPLTEREMTVLRYLQGMMSNLEIASELLLSVNTVKTHVRHICRKLHAAHRREAVRRARELRLL